MESKCFFEGSHGKLNIKENDIAAKKLAILIDVKCKGLGPTEAAKNYGYTKQHYYNILKAYNERGIIGLFNHKTGPKHNYVRTDEVTKQIISYKVLDPDISADVIVQKLNQLGYKISKRSVQRTIAECGLQKKTSQAKSEQKAK